MSILFQFIYFCIRSNRWLVGKQKKNDECFYSVIFLWNYNRREEKKRKCTIFFGETNRHYLINTHNHAQEWSCSCLRLNYSIHWNWKFKDNSISLFPGEFGRLEKFATRKCGWWFYKKFWNATIFKKKPCFPTNNLGRENTLRGAQRGDLQYYHIE